MINTSQTNDLKVGQFVCHSQLPGFGGKIEQIEGSIATVIQGGVSVKINLSHLVPVSAKAIRNLGLNSQRAGDAAAARGTSFSSGDRTDLAKELIARAREELGDASPSIDTDSPRANSSKPTNQKAPLRPGGDRATHAPRGRSSRKEHAARLKTFTHKPGFKVIEIDLHTLTAPQVEARLSGALYNGFTNGMDELHVIHGYRGGVSLRDEVHRLLQSPNYSSLVQSFMVPPHNPGMTIVRLESLSE